MSTNIGGRTWQAGPNASPLQILFELPLAVAALMMLPALLIERLFFKQDAPTAEQAETARKPKRRGRLVGLLCLALAALISGWVTLVFRQQGKGTPLPSAPPAELVLGGPFQWVRHPMYIAFMLVFYGVGRLLGLRSTLPLLALFSFYLRDHARGEEEVLLERYGTAYRAYQERVPSGLPFFVRS